MGEGSRMVRELFVMAREHAPSIIFMDEIDSIGSLRARARPQRGRRYRLIEIKSGHSLLNLLHESHELQDFNSGSHETDGSHDEGSKRLIPEYFPKIFGPNEDQELDVEASRCLFEELRTTINRDLNQELSLDQVAWGFIKIANETMCRPIRALTEARGYASSKHILSVFGGARGQHACLLARTLGITRIVIHRHASILSAYGMALADRVVEAQLPSATIYHSAGHSRLGLEKSLDALQEKVCLTLTNQVFRGESDRRRTLLEYEV
ncbi:uncharacterized protein PGTG_00306 [Puccinia graminis f. sp. tritici CRL 75-36-700-3]|uniref:ATPase AAA-type core domain-containing protein n=1 Tax=Puccinia graminis f. sp. tritici (strain CRL 75-36-700-3 / race SCCL) TaxID=418459 RepID=E3JRU0_PUCGT|nr:uncharacterized protein PGTG_00306 [Puccinia graminis f. sp. tritici CRL 75-36-700-3]EFP74350.2 hypothetical protein PGTG_00306 [Puccinia graminis f. sp. tritici CRL 75-36-700-3]